MYVFGGKDNEDEKLNDLWRLNLDTDVWEEIFAAPGSQKPIGRYGHSSATYNGHLIVFGGIHEITKELNDLYIFNFKTNFWKRLFKSQDDDSIDLTEINKKQKSRRDESPEIGSSAKSHQATISK
jgi:N-acetylneuraminic acid mutarotase